MLRTIKKFLFYNEVRPFIQKNVLILTQLFFLQVIVTVKDFSERNFHTFVTDISISVIVMLIWFSIKKYGVYYSNLVFLTLVPLFSWLIFSLLREYGFAGVIWVFPIIAVLFFCFYKYLAWLATVIILLVTFFSSLLYVPNDQIVSIIVALLMVGFCFISVFLNVYSQYDVLENKANTDHMTGLLNRNLLQSTLLAGIESRENRLHSVLIAIDLDNFKYINDTFGHLEGDKVLIYIAKLFKRNLRQTDSVFRMGGEEFLILLNNLSVENAYQIAESIRAEIAASNIIKNHTISISVGLAAYNDKDSDNWSCWLKRADDAMYKAKKTGKNKVVLAY